MSWRRHRPASVPMFVNQAVREYPGGREDRAMSSAEIVVIVVVIIVLLAIGFAVWQASRRRALRQRFGPEYDRVVSEQDSRSAAERELRERERRHAELDLKPLSEESRASYA